MKDTNISSRSEYGYGSETHIEYLMMRRGSKLEG